MKYSVFLVTIFTAGGAQADPGHLLGAGGHDHLIALGAIGAAIAAGLWGAVKGDWKKEAAQSGDEEPAEA